MLDNEIEETVQEGDKEALSNCARLGGLWEWGTHADAHAHSHSHTHTTNETRRWYALSLPLAQHEDGRLIVLVQRVLWSRLCL